MNENVVFLDGLYKDFDELQQKYGVAVQGNMPTKGWIQIQNDQVIDYSLSIDEYTITKGSTPVKNGKIKEEPILNYSNEYLELKDAIEKNLYLMPKNPILVKGVYRDGLKFIVYEMMEDEKVVTLDSLKEEFIQNGLIFDENSVIRTFEKTEYSKFRNKYRAKDDEVWIVSVSSYDASKVYVIDSSDSSGVLNSLPIIGNYPSKYLMKIPRANLQL